MKRRKRREEEMRSNSHIATGQLSERRDKKACRMSELRGFFLEGTRLGRKKAVLEKSVAISPTEASGQKKVAGFACDRSHA